MYGAGPARPTGGAGAVAVLVGAVPSPSTTRGLQGLSALYYLRYQCGARARCAIGFGAWPDCQFHGPRVRLLQALWSLSSGAVHDLERSTSDAELAKLQYGSFAKT